MVTFSKKITYCLFLRQAIFVKWSVSEQCFGKCLDVRTQGTNLCNLVISICIFWSINTVPSVNSKLPVVGHRNEAGDPRLSEYLMSEDVDG
jgi:hypothetical protein